MSRETHTPGYGDTARASIARRSLKGHGDALQLLRSDVISLLDRGRQPRGFIAAVAARLPSGRVPGTGRGEIRVREPRLPGA